MYIGTIVSCTAGGGCLRLCEVFKVGNPCENNLTAAAVVLFDAEVIIVSINTDWKTEDESPSKHLLMCVGVVPKGKSVWSLFGKDIA